MRSYRRMEKAASGREQRKCQGLLRAHYYSLSLSLKPVWVYLSVDCLYLHNVAFALSSLNKQSIETRT